jgi:hypothetical protein
MLLLSSDKQSPVHEFGVIFISHSEFFIFLILIILIGYPLPDGVGRIADYYSDWSLSLDFQLFGIFLQHWGKCVQILHFSLLGYIG